MHLVRNNDTASAAAVMPGEDPDYGDFPISIDLPTKDEIEWCEVYVLKDENAVEQSLLNWEQALNIIYSLFAWKRHGRSVTDNKVKTWRGFW
jgi:hypothetical protein